MIFDFKVIRFYPQYLKERFHWFPWMIYPLYLMLVFSDKESLGTYVLDFISCTLILLFFRVFDDYFCREYDESKEEYRIYLHTMTRVDHFNLLVFSFFIFSIYTIALYKLFYFVFLFTLLVSTLLYRHLKGKSYVEYVSLLKYILIILFLSASPDIAIVLAFFCSYLLFELRNIKGKDYLLFLIPLFIRLLGSY